MKWLGNGIVSLFAKAFSASAALCMPSKNTPRSKNWTCRQAWNICYLTTRRRAAEKCLYFPVVFHNLPPRTAYPSTHRCGCRLLSKTGHIYIHIYIYIITQMRKCPYSPQKKWHRRAWLFYAGMKIQPRGTRGMQPSTESCHGILGGA